MSPTEPNNANTPNLQQDSLAETVISSRPGVQLVQALRDLVEYRELFYAFVSRNIMIRYKQTALGVIWVILQPLITGVVFAAIFGLIRGQFSGIDALLFFMAGLVPWTSFQNGVQMAALSLEQNANLVSKVYFPRMTVPASQVISSLVDFLIAYTTLIIIALVGGVFTPQLIGWLLPLLFLQLIAGLGLGLFFSVLNAQYRDVKYIIPFILQLGMFITVWVPLEDWGNGKIGFGENTDWVSPYLYFLLSLNPMAAVVETYRALLAGNAVNLVLLAKGTISALVFFIIGFQFFTAREKRLVDIL
ncbi:MAG: ABC transporter permease [Sumerlaeia bacterium]